MIYSAHDVQVANLLEWLEPSGFNPVDVPYVSNFFFELHYDEDCLSNNQTTSDQCFTVQTLYNGEPLKFDSCLEANANSGRHSERCTFSDFERHI